MITAPNPTQINSTLKIKKNHSFAEGPESSSKNCSTKALLSVFSQHLENSTGCQFSGASNLSLPLSLSRPHTMKFHLISHVFLFLTVHPVFSGHLFLLTSCRSLTLTLCLVLAPSVQLYQGFGIPFLTIRSSNTLNSFQCHLKMHYFQASFNTP